jgi:hypothetical protein
MIHGEYLAKPEAQGQVHDVHREERRIPKDEFLNNHSEFPGIYIDAVGP